MYADESSSSAIRDEMVETMAADGRQTTTTGCSPFSRMISRVIIKCKGRQGRMRRSERMDYGAMAYPPAQTCYVRPSPTARTVAFTTAKAHAMPPQPLQAHAVALPAGAAPFGSAPPHGSGGGGGNPRKKKKKKKSKSKHVRFAPAAGVPPLTTNPPPPQAAAAHAHHHAEAEAATSQHPSAASAEAYSPAAAHRYGRSYAYSPSPLARWEMLGAPRRHEYFSSEYRWYYPTPVREGIYSLATDANQLTTIFSEENPNACAIV